MFGGTESLRPIQPDIRGNDGPVILAGATGGQKAICNDDLFLADARQAACTTAHFRTMQQECRSVDVQASAIDVVVRVLTGEKETLAATDQRPLHRYCTLLLAVARL